MTAHSELVARLEGASEGSRELDREIMGLTYVWEQRHIGARCWDDTNDTCCPEAKHLDWVWVDPRTDQWRTTARDGFEFTASLDAALALAERVLPGCRCMVERNFEGNGWAMVQRPGTFNAERVMTDGNTPALALCIAIIRAKEPQPDGEKT